ncbi:FCD domain-containing protein [Paraburkholderia dipogonis]|uniref:FCD domain-containing protein n=1 Tax=Paraburkholderia dipogonis TaxID=1211383 RepID=A0A4Y8MKV8_9BURK|nr:FCD domain-containing protein [Paraburkholderia dipogonis]TFE38064.1 FCD domain-containing protein [Paraburkholderia dipogonis]
MATPTTTRSLTTLTFERLREDILSGRLRPDERLRIQALSDRYDAGATAIREALSRLVTEGLVDSEDQRGFTVASVSRDELIDLTETRIQLEQMALRLAMERGDVEWETRVLSSLHRLSRIGLPMSPEEHVVWSQAHRQFHEALISGCRSNWTMRLCGLLYDKSERYRNLAAVRTTRERTREATDEHTRLMEMAMARDADGACELIAQHFRETTSTVLASSLVLS